MTFLQLVQRLRSECGIAGTGPTTVVSQSGELGRLVNWTADAWFAIQSKHQDWRFLRDSLSFVTVDGQATYTPAQCGITAGTFSKFIEDSFRNYLTSAGFNSEIPMGRMNYDAWRGTYQIGALRTTKTRPVDVTVTPNDSLGLGPVPLAGYTIVGDYYKAPVRMAANADQHTLPAKHDDMIIVYRALMEYGVYESAPELYAKGEKEYGRLIAKLEIDQLPEIRFAGSLA